MVSFDNSERVNLLDMRQDSLESNQLNIVTAH
jgi:hypothetical protein